MKKIKLLLVLTLFITSCSKKEAPKPDIKFEQAQWNVKDESNYAYRKQMVNNLLKNYTWQGMSKDSVINLLGQPDVIEEEIFMLYHYEQNMLAALYYLPNHW